MYHVVCWHAESFISSSFPLKALTWCEDTRPCPTLCTTKTVSMLRARRHASVQRLQTLLNQLIFFLKVRMTVLQLQCHIEETTDMLQDLGFQGHFIVVRLDQIHAEIHQFLRMCDRAIAGLEYRLIDIFLRRLHL